VARRDFESQLGQRDAALEILQSELGRAHMAIQRLELEIGSEMVKKMDAEQQLAACKEELARVMSAV